MLHSDEQQITKKVHVPRMKSNEGQERGHPVSFLDKLKMRSFKLIGWLAVLGVSTIVAIGGAQPPQPDNRKETPRPLAKSRLKTDRIVDLTHSFDHSTIYWPTEIGFNLIRGSAGITEKGYYYSANRFVAAEHGGTHIDAPKHFFKEGHTVDQIPLEKLIGEAVVVDVAASCAKDADYEVNVADFHRWETKHNRKLVDVIVLLRTGYGRYWKNREKYLGTKKGGRAAVADLHFPGLAPAAARWLVEHRAIKAIGIDTPSIDYGQSQKFQSHVTLFEHNVPAFENVANLENLPAIGANVVALPMKIGGGSGAPLRIIATVRH